MIWLSLMAQAATPVAADHSANGPMAAPAGPPSFAEEFDGDKLDRRRWWFDVSKNAVGWDNGEKQYYANARPENTRVEDGALVIEARRERLDRSRFRDWGGQEYTSARIMSHRAFGYGFLEVRAKLPCGRGTWPAIWMLPPGPNWPDGGEIDVMEMVGYDPNVVYATLHSGAYNHVKGGQRGARTRVPTSCTAYHDYQLDWRPDSITVGVDGRAFMRVRNDRPGGAAVWPYTQPFYLILNIAVGGGWGGQKGIDDAAFPQRMAIDHVRYWKVPAVRAASSTDQASR